MSARENIFSRLRASAPPAPLLPDVKDWYAAHNRNENLSQKIVRLRSVLEAAHAEVHDTSADNWPELLLRIATQKGLQNLLISAAGELKLADFGT